VAGYLKVLLRLSVFKYDRYMSDNKNVISDAAVAAAARAVYALRPATYYLDDSVVMWDQLGDSGSGQRRKDRQLAEARAALEAAAPHMLADAWAEGADFVNEGVQSFASYNPHRSQA
jgi:hypothetical protein